MEHFQQVDQIIQVLENFVGLVGFLLDVVLQTGPMIF